MKHDPPCRIDMIINQIYQLVGGFPVNFLSSRISQNIFFHMIGNKSFHFISWEGVYTFKKCYNSITFSHADWFYRLVREAEEKEEAKEDGKPQLPDQSQPRWDPSGTWDRDGGGGEEEKATESGRRGGYTLRYGWGKTLMGCEEGG